MNFINYIKHIINENTTEILIAILYILPKTIGGIILYYGITTTNLTTTTIALIIFFLFEIGMLIGKINNNYQEFKKEAEKQ